jgi:nucleotide-binding universal stress UspA family protein
VSQILIGNSLDKDSNLTVEIGLNWAKSLGLKSYILHGDRAADYEVLDNIFSHLNVDVHKNYLESILDANNHAIEKQIESCGFKDHESVKFESSSGRPADLIVKKAAAHKTELIVLGHDKAKSLADIFLGRVSESVLHRTDNSILVVKNQKAKKPEKILIAYDFSAHCDKAIEWAAKLSKVFGSDLHVVNIIPCYYQGYHSAHSIHNRFNEALESMVDESVEKIHQKMEVKLKRLKSDGINVSFETILDKEGSVSNKLVDYSDKNEIDLAILGSHRKGMIEELFVGSVALKMLKRSSSSVLVAK